jgi:cell filamentation protein
MAYSIDALTDDCYPDTTVLINKLDIREEAELAAVEAELVGTRIGEWSTNPLAGAFDFAHYKAIHAHLFGDLYDWAGQIRTVNLSKKGTNFCPADEIENRATLIFDRLKSLNHLRGLPHEEFIDEFVDFYCATNDLHPFREGNGRTQRVFLAQLAGNAGYTLNFSEIDGDLLMIATIQAAQGVRDLLRRVFEDGLKCL